MNHQIHHDFEQFLSDAVIHFEAALRAAGKADGTVQHHVLGAKQFVKFIMHDGDPEYVTSE